MPKLTKVGIAKDSSKSMASKAKSLQVIGFGSMKGIMNLDVDIDLTKPIYQQVFDGNGELRPMKKVKKAA